MGYVLKPSQERAVGQLVGYIDDTFTRGRVDELLLQAPTGAGKTVIVGEVFRRLADVGHKFVVLWVTPGKGDLAGQSEARLRASLLDSPNLQVGMLDETYIVGTDAMPAGDVRVVNWERISSGNVNRLAKGIEGRSFYDLLANTYRNGLHVLIVIDEAHRNTGKDTESAAVLRRLRDSGVKFTRLSVTATPDGALRKNALKVEMRYRDVVEDQLVRKGVLLNADLDRFADCEGVYRQVLEAAWGKQSQLTAMYEQAGSAVRPLLLIQYDTESIGKDNSPYREAVEEFLREKGVWGTKRHARWFSGEQVHVDGITSIDSPVRVLEFKQAIDTGWDCPRAQVLVQFREPRSNTFRLQTLGRFLRAPEQKHYATDDALNLAYVYSNLSVDVTIDPNVDVDEFQFWVEARRDDKRYTALNLPSSKKQTPRADVPPAAKQPVFDALSVAVAPLLPNAPELQISGEFTQNQYISGAALHGGGQTVGGQKVVTVLTGDEATRELDAVIEKSIAGFTGRKESVSLVRAMLVEWVREQPGRRSWTYDQCLYTLYTHARTELQDAIRAVTAELHEAMLHTPVETRAGWEVPAKQLVMQDAPRQGKGCLFEPEFVDGERSGPETTFEQYLAKQSDAGAVKWWWKNTVRGVALGVPYNPFDEQGQPAAEASVTYPDYLIMLASGRLWVVETKSVNDPQGEVNGTTHAKALGLRKWAAEQRPDRQTGAADEMLPGFVFPEVSAGVVVPHEGVLYVGDPDDWQAPTSTNLHMKNGWSRFALT